MKTCLGRWGGLIAVVAMVGTWLSGPMASLAAAQTSPVSVSLEQRDAITFGLIAEGGSTTNTQMRLKINASTTTGTLTMVEIEVKPFSQAFNGLNTVLNSLGSTSNSWAYYGSYPAGSYHWRARAFASGGISSGWREFGVAGNVDFITGSTSSSGGGGPTPSTVSITQLQQRVASSLSILPEGGTTSETSIQFTVQAISSGANISQFQLEVRPVGSSFTGTPTQTFSIAAGYWSWTPTVTLANGSYKWRARVNNAAGATTNWVEFGTPGNTDFTIGTSTPTGPTVSVSLEQRELSSNNLIPEGGTISTSGVRFRVNASTTSGTLSSIQLEIRPFTQNFTGTPTTTLTAGGTSSVGVYDNASMASNGYHWRARALTSTGLTSAWTEMGATGNTDFYVSTPAVQTVSVTNLQQQEVATNASIAEGGTVTTSGIRFSLSATASSGTLSLIELEYRPVGTAFSAANGTIAPGAVAGGTFTYTTSLATGSYKWRARAIGSTGATSAWVEFGAAGNTDFTIGTAPAPAAIAITLMEQRVLAGPIIAEGGTTVSNLVEFRVQASGATGSSFNMQIEVRPTSQPFTNTSTSSNLAATPSFTATNFLMAGSYKWQARVTEVTSGATSGWVEFGTAGNTDLIIDPNATTNPVSIGLMEQREASTNALIASGATIATDTVRLVVNSSTTSSTLSQIEVELRPTSSPLTGSPTFTGTLSGTSQAWSMDFPLANGSYHWQARVSNAAGQSTAWTHHGTSSDVDFAVDTNTAPPPVITPGPDQTPTPTSGSSRRRKSRCGLLGAEALVVLFLLGRLRNRKS